MNTRKLRGMIAERGTSQRKVAHAIGITEKSFYAKMRRGRFWQWEIASMAMFLHLSEVEFRAIFFPEVEYEYTQ